MALLFFFSLLFVFSLTLLLSLSHLSLSLIFHHSITIINNNTTTPTTTTTKPKSKKQNQNLRPMKGKSETHLRPSWFLPCCLAEVSLADEDGGDGGKGQGQVEMGRRLVTRLRWPAEGLELEGREQVRRRDLADSWKVWRMRGAPIH